ncbi:hypothetical protein COV15_02160 [Candidatus Woesearchaeota archaeon CG10_big_fil_rev_8_21_14_0_10_34_12]|nr:MAG: hypothetical protein COV15_02160 [Candidatus Woesearchaeota archaeon CG10_big_fil_rev_8_21_14_0_10_34_12]
MKICIVIDDIFTNIGGLMKSTERFAEVLSKKGHEIIFIGSKNRLNKESFRVYRGFKIYRFPGIANPFTGGIYYQTIPIKSKIREILKREMPDVIYMVSYLFLRMSVNEIARELNIPVVLSLLFQPENVTKQVHLDFPLARQIIEKLMKYICNDSARVVTCSKFSKEILEEYGVKKKIDVISSGVDLRVFNPKKISGEIFRKKFNLENKRFFLYVGRLMAEKNIGLLLQAATFIDWNKRENSDIKIVIVGDGNKREKLVAKAAKLGVLSHIIFTGRIDDELLKSAYKAGEVFIFPSFAELEGIVVLEAMALGKPLLISNSEKSSSRFLVENNGYTFDPFNPQKLAELMISFVNNNRKLREMEKISLKLSKKYDITKSVERLEGVFREVIAEKRTKKF